MPKYGPNTDVFLVTDVWIINPEHHYPVNIFMFKVNNRNTKKSV